MFDRHGGRALWREGKQRAQEDNVTSRRDSEAFLPNIVSLGQLLIPPVLLLYNVDAL
jgi:hypothetical protein